MFRGLYYTIEHCLKHRFLACSALFDRQIHQSFNIMDMGGFGMSMWTKTNMNLIKNMMRVTQENYPEMMGKLIICNAPMLFSAVYAVIKGWLDERTRKKISMCGSGYYRTLLEFVDEDQIPQFLGGKGAADFLEDKGPWDLYELVDSTEPGA